MAKRTIDTNDDIDQDDDIVLIDTSSNDVPGTIIDASEARDKVLYIQATDVTNSAKIAAERCSIGGQAEFEFTIKDEMLRLKSDGGNWNIEAHIINNVAEGYTGNIPISEGVSIDVVNGVITSYND